MDTTRRLVLASGSPRRRVLLRRAGFTFDVVYPEIEELPADGEAPEDMVLRLAYEKATAVADLVSDVVTLGADTAVVHRGSALGKPGSAREAVLTLLALSGGHHEVVTGYAVIAGVDATLESGIVRTRVGFRDISQAAAEAYVATGEAMDKAGAYAIQGRGRDFVSEIDGSFTNVMGLPIETIAPLLVDAGVPRRRPERS